MTGFCSIVALNIIVVDVNVVVVVEAGDWSSSPSKHQHLLGVGREDSDWWEMSRVCE